MSAQVALSAAIAAAPALSPAVRGAVLSHAWMAYVALFLPLVLIFVMFAVRQRGGAQQRGPRAHAARSGNVTARRCGTGIRGTMW